MEQIEQIEFSEYYKMKSKHFLDRLIKNKNNIFPFPNQADEIIETF